MSLVDWEVDQDTALCYKILKVTSDLMNVQGKPTPLGQTTLVLLQSSSTAQTLFLLQSILSGSCYIIQFTEWFHLSQSSKKLQWGIENLLTYKIFTGVKTVQVWYRKITPFPAIFHAEIERFFTWLSHYFRHISYILEVWGNMSWSLFSSATHNLTSPKYGKLFSISVVKTSPWQE